MKSYYEVEHHQYGIIVKGTIPLMEFAPLAKMWENQYGVNIIDTQLTKRLQACIVLTTKDKAILWKKELGMSE